jgi:hypothetical protein
MTQQEFIQHIEQTYRDGIELIKIKNADYAGNDDPWKNFRSAEVVGVSADRAILVRVLDKLARISNVMGKETMVAETVEDTLIDAINYLAILKTLLYEQVKRQKHN